MVIAYWLMIFIIWLFSKLDFVKALEKLELKKTSYPVSAYQLQTPHREGFNENSDDD